MGSTPFVFEDTLSKQTERRNNLDIRSSVKYYGTQLLNLLFVIPFRCN